MSERGDQVQKLLATLARYGDLIGEAFDGTVSGGDKQRSAGIEALFGLGVLKPYDEDAYRLNPRLREFFADHFASYHAMQALRQVTATVSQARAQLDEMLRLHRAGATRDADRLYVALDESIVDIAYSIEHNLAMLHSLLSTQYGNVDDLGSKLRQNRYYARQVERFLDEVQSIDVFVERTAEEAIAAGLPHVRQLVTRRLGARCLNWASQIKDAQAVISKRLFEAKRLEERVKRIARFSLWLTRHRTSDGWDVAVDERASIALFRPEPAALRPQPDVTDTDAVLVEGLMAATQKLPPVHKPPPRATERGPQLHVEDDEAELVPALDPLHLTLRELLDAVSRSDAAISLVAWKRGRRDLAGMTDEIWLLFSYMQLQAFGLSVTFVGDPTRDPFALNEAFHDVMVRRRPPLKHA